MGDIDHKLIDKAGIASLLELAVHFAEMMFARIPTLISSREEDEYQMKQLLMIHC
jgi:hypothetical protein